jgi:hypothetical protein
MAQGIVKALELESSVLEALKRLKQQERTILEERKSAEEYCESTLEALKNAEEVKEKICREAERNLPVIIARTKDLQQASNAGNVLKIVSLVQPLSKCLSRRSVSGRCIANPEMQSWKLLGT